MARGFVFLAWIGVRIVGRTAMAARDDDATARFFLEKIKKIEQGGVDVFFSSDDWKTVTAAPFAID